MCAHVCGPQGTMLNVVLQAPITLCLETGSATDLELAKWLRKLVGELRGLACLPVPALGDSVAASLSFCMWIPVI